MPPSVLANESSKRSLYFIPRIVSFIDESPCFIFPILLLHWSEQSSGTPKLCPCRHHMFEHK
ncbi:hypothetical protein Hanom_Chr13g01186741 [Helianthus anomalus]